MGSLAARRVNPTGLTRATAPYRTVMLSGAEVKLSTASQSGGGKMLSRPFFINLYFCFEQVNVVQLRLAQRLYFGRNSTHWMIGAPRYGCPGIETLASPAALRG